jgi:hypothetical protein
MFDRSDAHVPVSQRRGETRGSDRSRTGRNFDRAIQIRPNEHDPGIFACGSQCEPDWYSAVETAPGAESRVGNGLLAHPIPLDPAINPDDSH